MILLALAATSISCSSENPPPPKTPENPEQTPKKRENVSYFKNPSPPFEVELGEAAKESPAIEFLESGHVRLPLLYREWTFVGSRVVSGSESTFENFYMHPRHFHKFRMDHAWPPHIVIVRERFERTASGNDAVMGKPRGVSVAVYGGHTETRNGGWLFFDFGTTYPPANSAPPDGRPWFESADALLEFCPILRGIKR